MNKSQVKKYSKAKKQVPKSVKSYVKAKIHKQIEDKYVDTTLVGSAPNYNPTVGQLSLPLQGTGENLRVGDRIRPTRITLEGNIQGANTHVFRLILVKWKPYSTPVAGDILTNSFLGTFNSVNAPYEDKSKDAYQVIYDKKFDISATGTNLKSFKKTIAMKKLSPINFVGTNTITGTNKIWYIITQDGFTSLNQIFLNMRLFYEDA